MFSHELVIYIYTSWISSHRQDTYNFDNNKNQRHCHSQAMTILSILQLSILSSSMLNPCNFSVNIRRYYFPRQLLSKAQWIAIFSLTLGKILCTCSFSRNSISARSWVWFEGKLLLLKFFSWVWVWWFFFIGIISW